jgi:hypothetical protein
MTKGNDKESFILSPFIHKAGIDLFNMDQADVHHPLISDRYEVSVKESASSH